MSEPKQGYYYVQTWDADSQEWTPQKGVRTGPYTKWGLRKAIRKLRHMGYPCDYSSKGSGDPSVYVWREGWVAEAIERLNEYSKAHPEQFHPEARHEQ